jgi:hypothetical protein
MVTAQSTAAVVVQFVLFKIIKEQKPLVSTKNGRFKFECLT